MLRPLNQEVRRESDRYLGAWCHTLLHGLQLAPFLCRKSNGPLRSNKYERGHLLRKIRFRRSQEPHQVDAHEGPQIAADHQAAQKGVLDQRWAEGPSRSGGCEHARQRHRPGALEERPQLTPVEYCAETR